MRIKGLGLALLSFGLAAPALRSTAPCEGAVSLDEAVTHLKVRAVLLEKFETDALGIHLEVNGGNVILSGTVDNEATRDQAKAAALSVKGVASVENNIRVGRGPSTKAKDAARQARINWKNAILQGKVKGRLLEQVGENALKIDVDVSGGVVTLRGAVPTNNIRATALDTAKRTSGVTKVMNLLTVG